MHVTDARDEPIDAIRRPVQATNDKDEPADSIFCDDVEMRETAGINGFLGGPSAKVLGPATFANAGMDIECGNERSEHGTVDSEVSLELLEVDKLAPMDEGGLPFKRASNCTSIASPTAARMRSADKDASTHPIASAHNSSNRVTSDD